MMTWKSRALLPTKRLAMALSAAAAFSLLAPSMVHAAVTPVNAFITIDDAGLTNGNSAVIRSSLSDGAFLLPPTNSTNVAGATGVGAIGGNYPGTNTLVNNVTNEGVTSLGQVSMTFEYADAHPLANGVASTSNFNIMGVGGELSDTLSMTFTGHLDGTNNMSVTLNYLSDNDQGLFPPALVGGNLHSINETGAYQNVSAMIGADTGLAGMNVQFASSVDVPEINPGSAVGALACLSSGLLMLSARRGKRKGV